MYQSYSVYYPIRLAYIALEMAYHKLMRERPCINRQVRWGVVREKLESYGYH